MKSTSFLLAAVVATILLINTILSIKLLELRLQMDKNQILNYEFSSQLLRLKFQDLISMGGSAAGEAERTTAESALLNSDRLLTYQPGLVEQAGLVVVNVVRIMSLKSQLRLGENHLTILKLQFAFSLERNRKCGSAVQTYSDLLTEVGPHTSEAAFIRLHKGFCLALIGRRAEAIDVLDQTIRLHDGTTFAADATILRAILAESELRRETIVASNGSAAAKAVALADLGQCQAALEYFSRESPTTPVEKIKQAQCKERVGRTAEAISEYKQVVLSTNSDVAREANRRIGLIANIYARDEELKVYAREQGTRLGDSEIVRKLETAASKQARTPGLDVLAKELAASQDPGNQQLLKSVEEFRETTSAKPTASLTAPSFLRILLVDGRSYAAVSIQCTSEALLLNQQGLSIEIPLENLLEVRSSDGKPVQVLAPTGTFPGDLVRGEAGILKIVQGGLEIPLSIVNGAEIRL